MPVIHIMQGLPASGKSTLAKQFTDEGVMRFNLDDLRAMMGVHSGNWSHDREAIVISTMISGAGWALQGGNDIVMDNTHLVPRLLERYKIAFPTYADNIVYKVHSYLNVSMDECIKRDAERTVGQVGEKVIRNLNENYLKWKDKWTLTEEWMND